MESSLRMSDNESAAVQKTPNRVSLDSMIEKVQKKEFLFPATIPTMTICVVTMQNGYAVVGKSAPADPENFNQDLGEKFAYEDAIRQLWPLEGYALREAMTAEAVAEQ